MFFSFRLTFATTQPKRQDSTSTTSDTASISADSTAAAAYLRRLSSVTAQPINAA